MTTLTIEVPDSEVLEVSTYIKHKGGKVLKTLSDAAVKRSQKASLEKGLKEAILISRGEIKGKPLSQLWDE